jgi:uncharacterized protein (DUF983 family)
MIELDPAHLPSSASDGPARPVVEAMWRGFRQHCPACGDGKLFRKYLKPVDRCDACGEEMHHHRADDAPPYFTIFVVGHIVVGGILSLETAYAPPTWVHLSIWLPLILVMSLWLLPRVKGALIGLQWALRMHGFGGPDAVQGEPAKPV